MRRRTAGMAIAAVLAGSMAACGGPMSTSDGRKAANKERPPVARTYWKVQQALGTTVNSEGNARGTFELCTSTAKKELYYRVYSPEYTATPKETLSQLSSAVRSRLAGIGWNLRPTADGRYSATHGKITVRIWEVPSQETSLAKVLGVYVQGGCVDYGKATTLLRGVGDEYSPQDAASAPVPTAFATAAAEGS